MYFLDSGIRLSLDGLKIKDFDGYCSFGLIIHTFVDCSKITSAQLVFNHVFSYSGFGDGSTGFEILNVC